MIEAEGLTKRYGQTVALAGIDLQVPAGSILGVLGPNAVVLPGRQNLVMIGRLSGLRRREARTRAAELLDLAAGLVTRPPVLFLDEPTTGLDPAARLRMRNVIRELGWSPPSTCPRC